MPETPPEIRATDLWLKVVGFLQHNWAVIESEAPAGAIVYFIEDTSEVFDELRFPSERIAAAALRHNGFERYEDPEQDFKEFIGPPERPFRCLEVLTRPVYSSGEYWTAYNGESVVRGRLGPARQPRDNAQPEQPHNQRQIAKTIRPSPNHPFATVWELRRDEPGCGHKYRANSCDFHIRCCPKCQGGKPGLP